MTVQLTYELTGTGWSECTVGIGDAVATVTASYLGDALGDLASAVTATLRGHPKAVASFWEEPGEYRWILEPTEAGVVRVRILEFPQLYGDRPDEGGTPVLDAQCELAELATALLRCLEAVERTYGAEGYREKWVKHAFPSERVAELRSLLGAV